MRSGYEPGMQQNHGKRAGRWHHSSATLAKISNSRGQARRGDVGTSNFSGEGTPLFTAAPAVQIGGTRPLADTNPLDCS
jgi:hypothetical protein